MDSLGVCVHCGGGQRWLDKLWAREINRYGRDDKGWNKLFWKKDLQGN